MKGIPLPTLNYEPASKVMELPPGSRGYGASKIINAEGETTKQESEPMMGD